LWSYRTGSPSDAQQRPSVASSATPRRQLRTAYCQNRKSLSSCTCTSGWKISPNGANGSSELAGSVLPTIVWLHRPSHHKGDTTSGYYPTATIIDRRNCHLLLGGHLLLTLSTGVDWTIPDALQPATATCTPIPTSCCRFAVVPGTRQFVYCHNGSR
jgi:hypothetical protein